MIIDKMSHPHREFRQFGGALLTVGLNPGRFPVFSTIHFKSIYSMTTQLPCSDSSQPILVNFPTTALPFGIAPRGLGFEAATAYVGIKSTTTFSKLVDLGLMPEPRLVLGRRLWDRLELDEAFSRLPHRSDQATVNDDPWGNA